MWSQINSRASTSAESEGAVSVFQCRYCLTQSLPPIRQQEGGRQEKQKGNSRNRVTRAGHELKLEVSLKFIGFTNIKGQCKLPSYCVRPLQHIFGGVLTAKSAKRKGVRVRIPSSLIYPSFHRWEFSQSKFIFHRPFFSTPHSFIAIAHVSYSEIRADNRCMNN